MQSVRWLPFLAAAPDLQMALDQQLLADRGTASLRFFTWDPPGLSLGWFQRDPAEIAQLRSFGLPLVRRQTGGGAIVHWHELTFSLSVPVTHPLAQLPRGESYARVHQAFIETLREQGVVAAGRGQHSSAGKSPLLCFDRATEIDVVADDKKLMGSAQRRTRDRMLHHGSLILRTNPLQPNTAAVEDLSPVRFQPQEWATLCARKLESVLGPLEQAEFEPALLSAAEQGRATLVL
jgi:lipoate-protein ligase A